MKDTKIAVYIRLSLADEDTGKTKSESDSIGNQRMLINRFLDAHPTLSAYKRSEFVDAADIIGLKQKPDKRASL